MLDMERKAEELLDKCGLLAMASVNGEGYPRVCVVTKLGSESYHTVWVCTERSGIKAQHFSENPKASITYYHGYESVTLVGSVSIVEEECEKQKYWKEWLIGSFPHGYNDPEFCLLKFIGYEATMLFDTRVTMPVSK